MDGKLRYQDETLNGKLHCDESESVIRKKENGIPDKYRHYVPPKQLKIYMYYAIFSSPLSFMFLKCWDKAKTNTYIDKIFLILENALRIISFAH